MVLGAPQTNGGGCRPGGDAACQFHLKAVRDAPPSWPPTVWERMPLFPFIAKRKLILGVFLIGQNNSSPTCGSIGGRSLIQPP